MCAYDFQKVGQLILHIFEPGIAAVVASNAVKFSMSLGQLADSLPPPRRKSSLGPNVDSHVHNAKSGATACREKPKRTQVETLNYNLDQCFLPRLPDSSVFSSGHICSWLGELSGKPDAALVPSLAITRFRA